MRKLEYREALREAVIEEMERDGSIFLIGEDMGVKGGAYGVYKGLMDRFGPERVISTPISEITIAGSAVGAALTGQRPVAEIHSVDFTTLALDQIVNQAAKLKLISGGRIDVPLVIRTQGGTGRRVAAQHSQSLEAWFYHIPGLKLVMPATAYDAKGLLKSAIRDDGPVVFIEHKMLYGTAGDVPEEEYLIPLGKADIKRQGKDITLVTYSRMVFRALEAAGDLDREGISCEVIDPRTLVPLDIDCITASVNRTGRLMVVTESCRRGSVASDISATVTAGCFHNMKAPPAIVAGLDTPIPYNALLEDASVPGVTDIREAARNLVK